MSRRTSLLALVVAVGFSAGQAGTRPPLVEAVETSARTAPAGPAAVEVLRAWDARRAAAWARGDVRLLSNLYTPESVAGRRDRGMLRAWVVRGLVVRGLQTQLLEVREVRRTASTWTLRVTDRLAGGTAVGSGVSRPLPTDTATTRDIRLVHTPSGWRVSSVTQVRAGPA